MYDFLLQQRIEAARKSYQQVKTVCEMIGVSEEEYIEKFLSALPPLTWTSADTIIIEGTNQ